MERNADLFSLSDISWSRVARNPWKLERRDSVAKMAGIAGFLPNRWHPPRDSCSSASSLPSLPKAQPFSSRNLHARFPSSSIGKGFELGTADFHLCYRFSSDDSFGDASDGEDSSFDQAVSLFNGGDYHQCHDVLEDMWNGAEEPIRTIIHGILQCAVGFHHLFNKNHRGAMMELGEGLCKLRKMDFEAGPLLQFQKEISAALEFLYQTQKELAACTDEVCLAMDGSERSYQLLGSFAAGQHLYRLEISPEGISYILFCPNGHYTLDKPMRVKVPSIHATEEHLKACEYEH